MSEYAVVSENLTKRYGNKNAVDNVSLHIPQGSIYGFVGENGSGKTTIIRLLMGLATPTKGKYSLFDVDFKDNKIYSVRKNISAIVEAPSIVTSMTAFQNLEYACKYFGIKNYKQLIPDLLHKVGLDGVGKKKAGNFSLGMRQRLGIALLLLNNPKLVLLDEPMNGLDPTGVAELRDIIISLNKEGITFLISSHILSELGKVATHWGFISHGRLLKELSSDELAMECKKYIDLSHHELDKLEKAISKIGIKEYQRLPHSVRVFDEITPLDLLTKLNKEGLDINSIRTNDNNVEEYYLNLIGGGASNV